jgi:hypothetical protein
MFFFYAFSFCMTHDIHIFGLYGVGHLSCKYLAWALFKLPLRFAFLTSFCNHVTDIKILGIFLLVPVFFPSFLQETLDDVIYHVDLLLSLRNVQVTFGILHKCFN